MNSLATDLIILCEIFFLYSRYLSLRRCVEYSVTRESIVFMAALDAKEAFD